MFHSNMTVEQFEKAQADQLRSDLRTAIGLRNSWQAEIDRIERLLAYYQRSAAPADGNGGA